MKKVLISDKLHPAGVELLQNTEGVEVVLANKPPEDELCELIADVNALVVRSGTQVTKRAIEAASELEVIGRAGIGVDNIDVNAASRSGVLVMNAPSGNSITTAEHAIAMLMSLARKIPQATHSMKSGRWEKSRFMGKELYEAELGIIGLGNIGRLVAARGIGLGMKVIASDPFTSVEHAKSMGVELVEMDELLSRADAITIHAPLTRETKGIIGEKAFGKMKPGVLLVNCARGGIVDETALVDALEKNIVAGVALDVFEVEPPPANHPLLSRDNVICTPHLGASTSEAQEKVALELARQVADYLTDGTLRNTLNLPAVKGEVPSHVQPWVKLGRQLGRFQAQMFGGFTALEVTYAGAVFTDMQGLALVTSAVAEGLLSAALDVPVNLVNARLLAADQGITIKESKTTSTDTFANLITVELTNKSSKSQASAALFNNDDPRLVRLDNFTLEAPLEGEMLVLLNEDRPGVIGNVGTVLGSNELNVSRLSVGLNKTAGEAIALWNLDGQVPSDIVDIVGDISHIKSVKYVSL